ncbi:MAG: tetratricopeptide repeat protein [Acidobacteria bacterium]|nr:tetratricopeptide repeat protein [Acidobacteriota bacterium]
MPRPLPPDVQAGLNWYNDGFVTRSLDHFKELASRDPREPAYPFFQLFAWWDLRERTDPELYDRAYEALVQQVLRTAEARFQEDPADLWAHLFQARAYEFRARLRYYRGQHLAATRDAARAKGKLEQVLKLDPEFKEPLVGLGLYNYFVDLAPRFLKFFRFLLFIPGGDREKGLDQLERAMDAPVFGPEARRWLALIYYGTERRPADALALYQELHQRYPHHPFFELQMAHLQLYYLNRPLDSIEQARGVLTKVSARVPNYTAEIGALARFKVIQAMLARYDYAEALKEVRACLEKPPSDPPWMVPRLLLLQGEILEMLGPRESALEAYRKAEALTSHLPLREEARRRFQRAQRSQAGPLSVQMLQALALKRDGKLVEAEQSLAALREKNPQAPLIHFHLGDLYFQRQDYARAAAEFEAAARNDSDPYWIQPLCLLRLGQICDLQGKRKRALEYYKKVDGFRGAEYEMIRIQAQQGSLKPFTEPDAGDAKQKADSYPMGAPEVWLGGGALPQRITPSAATP